MYCPASQGSVNSGYSICFFFQAEDGIRDYKVTGVQTCALPIFPAPRFHIRVRSNDSTAWRRRDPVPPSPTTQTKQGPEIGRASCREREKSRAGGGSLEKHNEKERQG